ncbi:hypothetical protein AVEN_184374-1 [Araneus ventricosus]|uniref:Mos1 transposase HTH domain-containing protein n=1 Tax=Araneus ventricosus TaxID=182803 RepID=A0A4Y2BG81_ARAVE|nr:hypothetical protein AVEN_184374-1 [Araneus ventricosus]
MIPSEQYSAVFEELSKKIAAENESDALYLDGEVSEYSDLKADSETDLENNPVREEYRDSNSNTEIIKMDYQVDNTEQFRHHLVSAFNRGFKTAEDTSEIYSDIEERAMPQSITNRWFSCFKKERVNQLLRGTRKEIL